MTTTVVMIAAFNLAATITLDVIWNVAPNAAVN
jgi:hypothetical protein